MQLSKLRVLPPRLPQQLTATHDLLSDTEQPPRHLHLTGGSFEGKRLAAFELNESLVEDAQFTRAKTPRLSLRDVVLKHCDFTTADCSECAWLRVAMQDGRMTGWDCNQGYLEEVTFSDCKLDMANFRSATLKKVHFDNCILTEADFLGANLSDVRMDNCLLEKVEFSQAILQRVDLRASQLIDIRGWLYLKGAILDSIQVTSAAPYLARALGIVIED